MLSMNIDHFRQAVAHLALRQVAARYALRSTKRLLDVSFFRGLLLTESSVRQLVPPAAVECRFIDYDRLRHEATVASSGLQLAEVERLEQAGEKCFGCFVDNDVLASYLWFSPGSAHLVDDVFVHFDPSYAYSRWSFTRTDYRGRRLHAICKQSALAALAKSGHRGILSVVYAENFQSLNAAAHLGCVRVGWLGIAPSKVWTSADCRRAGLWLERSPGFHDQLQATQPETAGRGREDVVQIMPRSGDVAGRLPLLRRETTIRTEGE
jgi:hypothetical protein